MTMPGDPFNRNYAVQYGAHFSVPAGSLSASRCRVAHKIIVDAFRETAAKLALLDSRFHTRLIVHGTSQGNLHIDLETGEFADEPDE